MERTLRLIERSRKLSRSLPHKAVRERSGLESSAAGLYGVIELPCTLWSHEKQIDVVSLIGKKVESSTCPQKSILLMAQ